MSRSIMLLGTASSVGKSTIATAICRYYTNKGFKVAPFKALNISLNSYVTEEGLEMGRAQVVQAEACNLSPKAWMNPVLLKPSANMKTQVIVNGKVKCTMDAYKYKDLNKELKEVVKDIYNKQSEKFDLMVLEGSGSCAEINLKDTDIANMYMAKVSNADVILVADIDRGGVFASVVGTIMLLEEEERKRVKGIIINKFRGNIESFKPAMKQLEDIIKIPVLGVMPYYNLDIEDEDSVTEKIKNKKLDKNKLDIAIIKLKHMSNFTDFNALERFENVNIRYVESKEEVGKPHVIIIPGSKNTIEDLRVLKGNGIYEKIKELQDTNIDIIGICGGYQMLGNSIEDKLGVEGEITKEIGFEFLNTTTFFNKEKTTKQVKGKITSNKLKDLSNKEIYGYEIHNGITLCNNKEEEFIKSEDNEILGAINKKGNVFGTYIHGLFDHEDFTKKLINYLCNKNKIAYRDESKSYKEYKLLQIDNLASVFSENINIERIYKK